MNTYQDLHAVYYDLVYATKPYAEEARFVVDHLEHLGAGPGGSAPALLDLACGTGRHAVAFAALGYAVTGVDWSEDLLASARRNAASGRADARFVRQDMRALDLDRPPFTAITCLFDAIGYPLSNDGIVATLVAARRHLAPAGALAVEFLHAPAMLLHASPVSVRRFATPEGGELVRISESRLDHAAQVVRVSYDVIDLKPGDASYERSREVQENRFFSLEEMRALMASAGLEVESFVPAYAASEAIDDGTWHVLALARASSEAGSAP